MTSPTTDRRLGLTGGTAIKAPCRCATTANITLSGLQTIDGITTVAADRVLVKNQTTGADNGVYVADTGTWTRDYDFDGSGDIVSGTLIFVTSGSANGSALCQVTTADPITIGTTSLTITKIATLSAGAVSQTNVQNGQFIEVAAIAGTNTITGTTVGTAPAALGHGQYVFFVPANTNTGATTFNRDGLGGVNIFYGHVALVGGELVQNVPALLFHDGTQYDLIASAKPNVIAIGFLIDGGGAVPSTGVKGDLLIPFSCTINSVTLQADQSGSIVVDIWKKAYAASSPPTVANTITASALPTLSTAQSSQDTTLTGWTTAIAANDMLRFNINSVTTCQRVTLTLKATKT